MSTVIEMFTTDPSFGAKQEIRIIMNEAESLSSALKSKGLAYRKIRNQLIEYIYEVNQELSCELNATELSMIGYMSRLTLCRVQREISDLSSRIESNLAKPLKMAGIW